MKPAKLYKQYRPARMPREEIMTIEVRILRALKTLRAIDDPDAKFLKQFDGRAISWPEVVRDRMDWPDELPRVRAFKPKPEDVSRMLGDLALLNGLSKNRFRLIWWRSFDYPFSYIAARIGRSSERARQLYNDAIHAVRVESLRGQFEI